MDSALIFIIGLVLGSFLSVLFTRLEVEGITGGGKKSKDTKGILFGRSKCDHCGKPLPWYDNLPLLSFLALAGRCRHCGQRISGYHPLLELSSGLYLVAAYMAFGQGGLTWQFFVAGLFGLVMILLYAYDLRHQLIPNVIVVPAIAIALLGIAGQAVLDSSGSTEAIGLFRQPYESYLLGALAAGGFFLLLSLLSRGTWIGGGDIKLGFLMGLLLGWPYVLVAVILSYFIGTAYALLLLLTRQASLTSSVPFGPFLVMGFFIAVFYADVIVNWYEKLVI